jgi:hypothetical protein
VDDTGQERSQAFARRVDAQRWLDGVTASLVRGEHVTPRSARMTTGEWADTWLAGYSRRKSTVRQAEVHIKVIKATFGAVPLSAVKPSDVKLARGRRRRLRRTLGRLSCVPTAYPVAR